MTRKIKLSLIIVLLIILSSNLISHAEESKLIYETSHSSVISSGVVLDEITRFMSNGWLKINVLKIDVNNPNVTINNLFSTKSINKPTTTLDLAKQTNSIAAINGSFFTYLKDIGQVSPIGMLVNSGIVMSNDAELNLKQNKMANFLIDDRNQAFSSYLNLQMTLTAPNGQSENILRYNKPYYYHEQLCIIDSKMSTMSIGSSDPIKELAEMVVDNGVVTKILTSDPPVQIPQNGYVVIGRKSYKDFLINNFKIGDKVSIAYKGKIDIGKIKTTLTGGAMVVTDGNIPDSFSHDASNLGRNPRTSIGVDKTGKIVYMVTIDGRQKNSIGMTMSELAKFMKSIGAYSAINLDGGGSTTLVARRPGNFEVTLVNSPSDGTQRQIANAVGVFTNYKGEHLQKLNLKATKNKAFIGDYIGLDVFGVDQYENPIKIDISSIKWSNEGIEGYFKDNKFYPLAKGNGLLTASLNDVTSSLKVESLGYLTKKIIDPVSNEQKTVDIDFSSKINDAGYKIAVIAQNMSPRNILENLYLKKLCHKANRDYHAIAFVGAVKDNSKTLNIPYISTFKGTTSFILGESKFIQLDSSNKSLNPGTSDQWSWLINELKSFSGKNIFIFMANNPQNFSDQMEYHLLIDVLKDSAASKKVWIIFNDGENTLSNDENIKFFGLKSFDTYNLTPTNENLYQYFVINIVNGTPQFTYASLF